MTEKEHEKELEKLKQKIGEGFTDELDKKVSSLRESLSQLKNEEVPGSSKNRAKPKEENQFKNSKSQDGSSKPNVINSDFFPPGVDGKNNSKDFQEGTTNEKNGYSQESNTANDALGKLSENVENDFEKGQKINTLEKPAQGKVDMLENSIKHLDNAIQSLIKIIGNAKNGFSNNSGTNEKLDEIIRQNRAIISKLNQIPGEKSETKTKTEQKEEGSSPVSSLSTKSPFLPKPNVPHMNYGFKKNPAPRPPEDDNDTTIPYLKPRREKKSRN
ncbi:MAG: hypothetical protein ACOCQG_01985 [Candidatus Nanoarchaeia archaeon]